MRREGSDCVPTAHRKEPQMNVLHPQQASSSVTLPGKFRGVWQMPLLLIVLALLPLRGYGQSATDRAFAEEVATASAAVVTALAKVRAAGQGRDVGFYTGGWCTFGAFLRSGQSISMTTQLDKDTGYVFVAAGDDNASDVDVEVQSESGVRLASDTDSDKAAVTGLIAERSGKYRVKTTMYRAKGDSFCVLVMLEVGQKSLPAEALAQSMAKWVSGSAALYAVTRKHDGAALTLKHGDRDWVFFGAALEDGDSVTFSGMSPGRGRAVLYACGDENATDIDAAAKDSDGDTIAEDEDDDPTPIVQWSTSTGETYKVNVTLVSTKAERSFVVASVFKRK